MQPKPKAKSSLPTPAPPKPALSKPSLKDPAPKPADFKPVLEILDDLVPAHLHAAAWKRCSGAGWYFGHASVPGDRSAFWKLDLDGDAIFNTIWEQVRPRCEELAGTALRVRRQYANGHTYGLGGRPHRDDGQFTLLYYPNPEWQDGWEGETMYYERSGEIARSVRLRPNRCVFFDAGILHSGRAPSRDCGVLRVTVAFKLERVTDGLGKATVPAAKTAPVVEAAPPAGATGSETRQEIEISRVGSEGSQHSYALRIPAAAVEQAIAGRLANLGRSVRIPGFRPGEVPAKLLNERYGKQARADCLNLLAGDALSRALPQGSVASTVELKSGADSGDLELHITATHFPDLPAPDFSKVKLNRVTAKKATLKAAGVEQEAAAVHFRNYLKAQVLDHLDAAYAFRILPSLVEREFKQIWQAAQSQTKIAPDVKARAESELRAMAERRLRLGYIVAEMARRNRIQAQQGAELEDRVIDHFVAQARVQDRVVTADELREMLQG